MLFGVLKMINILCEKNKSINKRESVENGDALKLSE